MRTITPTDYISKTVSAFGTVFTSDSNAYISYNAITAFFDEPITTVTPIGTTPILGETEITLPGGFLAVPSAELQSFRGAEHPGFVLGNAYPFNFADLAPNHVPLAAYQGMGFTCISPDMHGCSTIYEDRYAPNIVSEHTVELMKHGQYES
jgi:hypothetical protein